MYKEIAHNKRKTVLLMLIFVLFIGAIGGALAYFYDSISILVWVVTLTLVYTVFQYFLSGKVAVAMSGAKPIVKRDNPRFYNTVENLAIQQGLPMPQVYIINDPSPNAFAAGRDPQHAVLAATTGLLELMDDAELRAVVAHEFAHIKNYDIRLSTIVFGLVSAIALISDIGWRIGFLGGKSSSDRANGLGAIALVLTAVLAPIIALIVQMAVSRNREYLADSTAALTTRHPEAMIAALRKLGAAPKDKKPRNAALAALYINDGARGLFSTHPSIAKRIARLEAAEKRF